MFGVCIERVHFEKLETITISASRITFIATITPPVGSIKGSSRFNREQPPPGAENMIQAKDAEPGKMYRMTKLTQTSHNDWYVRPEMSAQEYVDRLKKLHHGVSGKEMFHLGMFKSRPDVVLFVRYSRGTDTFNGKYEVCDKVFFPPDQKLREIDCKPGFRRQERVPSSGIGTSSEVVPLSENGTNSTGLQALTKSGGLIEDVLQSALDEVISEVKN